MPEILRLAALGLFRPDAIVTRRFTLDEADAAYAALDRGEILGRAIVVT
jgi:S-(hydroxymethyl)glutathione dehydrogenase/alcohol dehydrogenase